MYYSNGNYEAFAKPKKPKDVDQKSAYLVGAGLASLAAAAFLVRDGQMKGENIHILEELPVAGGSLDGILDQKRGFIIRGGREMENHFETLWDLFRSVPSLEIEGASVLDEFYWLNKEDPNFSKCRVILNQGQDAKTENKFNLSDKSAEEMMTLFFTPEEALQDKRIDEVFSPEFFESNFWIYWSTMFAFETWHSAMEMRRYVMRFIHHLGGLPDLSAVKFTKYNQYESLVLPLKKYLEDHGVSFQYNTTVENVLFSHDNGRKMAHTLITKEKGQRREIKLTENDLVFITNGSVTENTTYGDNNTPAKPATGIGGSWQLWENIAAQDPAFGNPKKFYKNLPKESWFVSATITTFDDKITPYIQRISKRDPHSGKVVTGGIVTVKDSNWMISYTLNRQPHFKAQPKGQLVVWFYGLLSDKPGNYVKKLITECSGIEIASEWLYHLGVPVDEIEDLAKNSCSTVPVYMPYITSYFMPRAIGDRPLVVPENATNFAFIGNFSETPRDTTFTTEYSVRTAMEAVYTLLNVDRGVPEVHASAYDIRVLLHATSQMLDGKQLKDLKLPLWAKMIEKGALKRISNTEIGTLLRDAELIDKDLAYEYEQVKKSS